MSKRNPERKVGIIINRLAQDLDHIGSEINKLLGQIYGKSGKAVIDKNGEKRKIRPPLSGLKYPEVRKLILDLRSQYYPITQISNMIKKKWHRSPEKFVSKSTIYRFIERARKGQLYYYDFDLSKRNKQR